jgi:hypothetical protein
MDMKDFCVTFTIATIILLIAIAFLCWVIDAPVETVSCDNLILITNQKIRPIAYKDGCEILVADKYWIPFDQWLEEMQ